MVSRVVVEGLALAYWGVVVVSDTGMAVLVFAVTAVALPLIFLAAWSLFKNLMS